MKGLGAVVVFGALLSGCDDDDACCSNGTDDAAVDAPGDASASLSEVALVPSAMNPRLDVLFVMDDSSGMLDKQARFAAQMANFFDSLRVFNVLPDLHIGVVSTDLGTRGTEDAEPGPALADGRCDGVGKAGVLQIGNAMVTERFLRDSPDPAGSGRVMNYTGTREEALAQMMTLGADGCPFEQPLEAIRRALTNPENAGFLRASARLAIVVVTDEDDCSMTRSALLYGDAAALGTQTSFRCTRFGVTCDVGGADSDQMRMPGPKAQCQSNETSSFLTSVADYASFLTTLKADPRDVFLHAIAAPPAPVLIGASTIDSTTHSYLVHSCSYEGTTTSEYAYPPVRIADLFDRMPHSSMSSICSSYSDEARSLGLALRDFVGFSRCVDVPIAQPAQCEAVDIAEDGAETALPMCSNSVPPCFSLVEDFAECRTIQGLKVEVSRGGSQPANVWTSVRCAL